MKAFKWILSVLIALSFFSSIVAQTITVLDTNYAPGLVGTLFKPSGGNGYGVLAVHGSGVTRQTNRPWCDTLAAHGYTVFTIEYSTDLYPGPVRDIKHAIEFLRRNEQKFGITTGKIAGLGFSDGSSTLAQSIIWDNDDAFFQTDPIVDDHFDAVILLYGSYSSYGNYADDTQRQKGVCIKHVSNITTPVFLIHDTGDTFDSYEESVSFNDSLVAYGKESKLLLFNGLQHGFDLNWPLTTAFTSAGLQAKDSTLSFLGNNLIITAVDEKLNQNNSIKLYPNPVSNNLFIQHNPGKVNSIEILDMAGRKNTIRTNRLNDATMEIKTHNLKQGMYIIRINTSQGSVTRKFLKE